jgi:transmembrane sensor
MADQEITIERLAANEHFQQWVLAPTPELDQYWKNWLQDYPEHQGTLLQARQLILSLQLKGNLAPKDLQQQIWTQVKVVMEEKPENSLFSRNRSIPRLWVAASLLFMLAGVILFISYYADNTVSYRTAYGETKTIFLPDGSTVILNANSSFQFVPDWEETQLREVWLEGEAFFDVKQIPLSTDSSNSTRLPFVVHSSNMDVEVLGTAFNVKDRYSHSEVVLNTGKVSVTPKQKQKSAPIAMEPGDRLAYSVEEQAWKIQQVNPEVLTSWRNQELIFDEMQLADIALLLEEVYGYEITFESEEIKTYSFTGNIKTQEIELLIPMLERSFKLEIQRNGKDIKFLKR